MSLGMWGFILWGVFFVIILILMVFAAQRSRRIVKKTEEAALAALPLIGEVAEKKHIERFGRPATELPPDNGLPTSNWYPDSKDAIKRP